MKRVLVFFVLLILFSVQTWAQPVVVSRFQKVVITSNASDALVVSGTATAAGFVGPLTGNASTATALQTPRAINGVNFDGTTAITVTAAAGTLTGTTLNATVVSSSLQTLGTITAGVWQGTKVGLAYGGTNADLSATGGTSQVLKQATLGAGVTVGQLSSNDLSDVSSLVTLTGSQSITSKKLGSLTTNGFVKTSAGDGTLSVDTSTYITGNQTITLSGDDTGSGTTAITTTVVKVNGVSYGTSPSTNTVPVVTGVNAITYEQVPNAALANSTITINGTSTSLGGTRTLSLASSDFANQGTTTTVYHGNAAGNPSFGSVVNADIASATIDLTTKVTGTLPSANGGSNNAFFAVSGPSTSTKTFTFPNASATVLTDSAVVTVAQGGSGVGTLTGVLKGNGTGAFTAVAVPGNTTTFLRGDFTFATPTVSVTYASLTDLSGNAYDFALGNGTFGHTVDRGSIATTDPFIFKQTWNGAGQIFKGFIGNFVQTAQSDSSTMFELQSNGTPKFVVNRFGLFGANATNATSDTAIVGGNMLLSCGGSQCSYTAGGGQYAGYAFPGRSSVYGSVNGALDVSNSVSTHGIRFQFLADPTVHAATCGTSPSIRTNSSDSSGQLVVGTGSPASCTVDFNITWNDSYAPNCTVVDSTNTSLLGSYTVSTTQLIINAVATFGAGDKIYWSCVGHNFF